MFKTKSQRRAEAGYIDRYICYLDLGSDAPAPDPLIGQSAKANAAISADTLEFNKQVYEDNKPRQKAIDELSKRVVDQQLEVGDFNQQQAVDQWARFQELFVPVEDRVVSDAMDIDSAANLEKAAGDAGAQVERSYRGAEQSLSRNLASMGILLNISQAKRSISHSNDWKPKLYG
jgi:hypothetical protein